MGGEAIDFIGIIVMMLCPKIKLSPPVILLKRIGARERRRGKEAKVAAESEKKDEEKREGSLRLNGS